MAVTGPDFISLQVRDLERSAAFYEQYLGLKRSDAGPPHAVVFDTKPIAFAVRDVVAGTDLDAIAQPGQGMALWLHAPDAQDIHDALAAFDGPVVEVHLSNPNAREPWRHTSVVAPVAVGSIMGFGTTGYELAVEAVARLIGGPF